MFQNAFVAQVESSEALLAIFARRVTPILIPEGSEFPALVYWLLPSPLAYTQDGLTDAVYETVNLQTVVYARTYAGAWAAAVALRTALVSKAATWDDGGDDELDIGACLCTYEGDSPILRPGNAEGFCHGVAQSWEVRPQ